MTAGGERVLVVDDDAPIRRMLARTLVAEGYQVALAADGGEALADLERAPPDLVILDVAMPGLDGLAVCRRIRRKGLGTPILMLTARDAVADRVAGLDAGADDYLVKPFASEELAARARALLRRGWDSGGLVSFAGLTLDPASRRALRGRRTIELTARETALLALLMRRPRTVVSREVALAEVWEEGTGSNVVDRYVAHLRRKLGDPPLIHTVRGLGFTLRG
jgi:two-component system response regulator MprA